MASSSSTSAAAAGTTYQVFLSFRGPDTRQGFTDVLYHALVDAGVRVFRDNEEIRKGEEIGEEILRAIEESRIFVPIFSRGYASSKWCLIEFTKMMELKEGSSGKKIIPIFYDVGVDDVKLRTDLYSKALEEHSEKYGAETVKPWEEALRQAGKFKGWELGGKGHAELAKLVVGDVSMKLKVKHKSVTEYLVRRDDQVEALMKLLDIESSDVRFLGIYGMGGIGKTTLAKIVFNKLCDRFDGCSFLANIRESSGQHKGIESLQKQLLANLGIKSKDIMDARDGINRLRETLARKNVLILLDDVDSKEQIRNLAGDASWFGPGSRIIITTRDQSVYEIRPLGIQTLEVEDLKPEEATRLFCMHAFQKDSPPDDYLSLSEEAVKSTGRLPLALAVIGSLLGDKPRQEWADTIERLKKVPHKDVQKQLMISYEGLSHGTKHIFLDIACFFIGQEKTYPIYMWQACDFDPEMGLRELVYMSLVKIIVEEEEAYLSGVKRKKFWMHDQLRDLGRKIVYDESFEDGVKPASRIWMHEDVVEMLQEEEGRENVEMIRLRYHVDPAKKYTFTKRDLSRFGRLRYFSCFSINDGWKSMMIPNKLRGRSWHKYPPLLPKLRWLNWYSFPPKFWQVEFCLSKLVILELPFSDIDENWRGWNQFGVGSPLKVLNLSGCRRLKRMPNTSVMKSVVELDLSETSVAELPDTIGKLVKLEVLSLRGCQCLKKLPVSIGNMRSLVKLDLSVSGITELPDSIGNLENLRVMDMSLTEIKELPSSFGMLKRLEELRASSTPLEEIPSTFEGLTCLRVFELTSAPHLRLLPPKLPTGLTDVQISSYSILQRVPEFSNLQNLVRLVLNDDLNISGSIEVHPIKLEGIGKLRRLVELELDLRNVTCIPEEEEEEFSSLPQLQTLTLGCRNLQHCPPLPSTLSESTLAGHGKMTKLPRLSNLKNLLTLKLAECSIGEFGNLDGLHLPANLRKLYIVDCKSLKALLALSRALKNLKELTITGAHKLVEIPELGELESLTSLSLLRCEFGYLDGLHLPANLRKLDIRNCMSLEAPLALSHLKNLTELTIGGAKKLVEIPELGELESLASLHLWHCQFGNLQDGLHLPSNLRKLHIEYCMSVEALPALSHLKNLTELSIEGAGKLVEIPELRELDSLQVLSIRLCRSLRGRIQNLSKLKMLRRIHISGCPKFRGIDGICELESLESLWITGCDCKDALKSSTNAAL